MNRIRIAIVSLCLLMGIVKSTAQSDKVDSIVALIKSAIVQGNPDTIKIQKVQSILSAGTFSDEQRARLAAAVDALDAKKNPEIKHYIQYVILNSMIQANYPASTIYGKELIENLEQSNSPDARSLEHRVLLVMRVPFRNSDNITDGFEYYNDKLRKYVKLNDAGGRSVCYFVLSTFYYTYGLYDQAIYNFKKSQAFLPGQSNTGTILNLPDNRDIISRAGSRLYVSYLVAKGNYQEALRLLDSLNFDYQRVKGYELRLKMDCFLALHKLDSLPHLVQMGKEMLVQMTNQPNGISPFEIALKQSIASYYIACDSLQKAQKLLQECRSRINAGNIPPSSNGGILQPEYFMAMIKIKQQDYGAAIDLLIKDTAYLKNLRLEKLQDYRLLASLYEKQNDYRKAAALRDVYLQLQDSVLADQNRFRSNSFETEQQISGQEHAIAQLQSDNRYSKAVRNSLIGLAILVLAIAVLIYYRYKSKQKANILLQQTLDKLKATQSQLIQSEKMASLGELTAGIAHEIQNPLNFVNNFSEVNNEMVEEVKEEINKGNYDEAKVILNDIKENSEKINHHGKRADAIVKGMLQHSRSSSGQKEPTDINALCDEYLRLSYHGLRAKDNSFNATIPIAIGTEFDASLSANEAGTGNINIISQDIGRVLLNLINNAFYAVNEKRKSAVPNYEPIVLIKTQRINDKILIAVVDNGNGIPDTIKDKIFQPFFTTKPTGQGTGLGLSLCYDIVKAQGGQLEVETEENKGSTFKIMLKVDE